jgi:putative lipoprotein (rSAM/lipoprotein system)
MAEKIKKIPNRTFIGMLKFLNALMALVLGIFCFATGQTPKAAAGSGISGTGQIIDTLTPDYGVQPLYGVIPVEYGVPYTEYKVDGSIGHSSEEEPVEGLQDSISYPEQEVVLDSAYTDSEGAFSLNFTAIDVSETWVLRIEDVDGPENGSYSTVDTLITIPLESTTDSNGVYTIQGNLSLDLLLQSHSTNIEALAAKRISLDLFQASPGSSTPAVRARYNLPEPSQVRLAVYNAQGMLKQMLVDAPQEAGEHSVTWNKPDLAGGVYYFKMTAGKLVLVKKAMLSR